MQMVDENHAKLVLFLTIKPSKNQSSMTTKQFQEYVVEFINEPKLVNQRQEETNKKQAEFNQYVIKFIKEQKEFNQIILKRLDRIELCPTIQKELNGIS
ncbi:hypothetical protein IKD56_04120 [bacterium]|nr:hypothetical protein [bacterium]